jgi:hypothetical protein
MTTFSNGAKTGPRLCGIPSSSFELGAWMTKDVVNGRFDRDKIAKTETNGSKIETSKAPAATKSETSESKIEI